MLLETPPGELSWKAKEFSLKDPGGNSYALSEQMGKQGLLIAFICNHCPYVKAIADRFARDAKELQQNGINVLAIMSNDYHSVPSDSPENMERFSRQYGFSFPYLIDEDQAVAHAYGAVCTPDFFGFNSKGELQYRGRLDNARMGNPENRNKELVNAMLQIAVKGAGPEQQFPSMGCSIKWQ